MHLKVLMKLEKTLKSLSSGQKNPKKPKKNPKNPKKTQKNPLGWVFLKKTRVFSNPGRDSDLLHILHILVPYNTNVINQGLINDVDTKSKCRHFKKIYL
jgi:hypothetical protein